MKIRSLTTTSQAATLLLLAGGFAGHETGRRMDEAGRLKAAQALETAMPTRRPSLSTRAPSPKLPGCIAPSVWMKFTAAEPRAARKQSR